MGMIGGFPYEDVQLNSGEQSIARTTCSHKVDSWWWHNGQLYVTTDRLVWIPALRFKLAALFPSGSPVCIDRNQILRVDEDSGGLWMPLKWTVETDLNAYLFSFGPFTKTKRRNWIEDIRQWASL
jgi:hypothetical protein